MPNFAYFGTPYVARDTLAMLVKSGYAPSVVITSPDSKQGRGMSLTPSKTKAWALEAGIPVLTPASLGASFIEELKKYEVEYGICVAYGKIIPQAVISSFPKGILNIHYSLLPAYRGASPVESALWNGETKTGVTVQQMAYELDSGDILAQKEVAIEDDDTTLSLRPRLIEEGADLLIQMLPSFINGTSKRTPQDSSQTTHAPKIRKEQGLLDLHADPIKNWHTYRALLESPGTYFFAQKGESRMRVKIKEASLQSGKFIVSRITPEGKGEQDFSYLQKAGWSV